MAAKVLPVPVGALSSRLRPAARAGQAALWAAVGCPNRRTNQRRTTPGSTARAASSETAGGSGVSIGAASTNLRPFRSLLGVDKGPKREERQRDSSRLLPMIGVAPNGLSHL